MNAPVSAFRAPIAALLFLALGSVALSQITVIGRWRLGEGDVTPGSYVSDTNNGTAVGSYTYNMANSNAYPLTKDAPSGITYSSDVPSASLTPLGASTVSMNFSYGQTGEYGGLSVGVWGNTSNGGSMTNVINNFAIEAWIKPTDTSTNGNGLAREIIGLARQDSGIQIMQNGTSLEMRAGSTGTVLATYANVSTTEWTHVAVAVDNNYNTFYVNGAQVGQASALGGVTVNGGSTSQYFGIGEQSAQYGGQNFIGLIDEARFFTFTAGTFNPAMLNYATAIPEPSAWALLLGLGALGGALWRRRGG